MPSLGEEFVAAREARGLSLSDVAERIHIRATYLQAIEEEDWPQIGAPVYVRGFLRTYARFLGIDPERAVETFNAVVPSPPASRQTGGPVIGVGGRRGPSIWVWIAAAVAVALLGYVGYGYYQLKTGTPVAIASPIGSPTASPSPAPGSAAEQAEPVSTPGATPGADAGSVAAAPSVAASSDAVATGAPSAEASPTPTPPARAVSLRLTQPSWLRVSVDGKVAVEGVFPAGTMRDFRGKHVHVYVGNAGGVEVTAPGRPAKVLGDAGEVVQRDYQL